MVCFLEAAFLRIDNILAFVNLQCCPDGTCEYVLCLSVPVAAEKQFSNCCGGVQMASFILIFALSEGDQFT